MIARFRQRRRAGDQRVLALCHIFIDLAKQGWDFRVRRSVIQIKRPTNPLNPEQDRERIRQQLHAERDEQLRQEPVQAFIRSMEARRVYNGKPISIFSLMRDGRHLMQMLSESRTGGTGDLASTVIEPYVQFVTGEQRCEFTGLRLVDIWRYFRHTWSMPYKSVPGRIMMVLVRDGGAPFHPVIGIAALSSATVGSAKRDEFIGWTYRKLGDRILQNPSLAYVRWMLKITDETINEIYKQDLLADGSLNLRLIKNPTADLIGRLISNSRRHRKEHYRFMQGQDYKQIDDPEHATDEDWEEQAKSLLFRSKREQELANLLQIRISLNRFFDPKPTIDGLKRFLGSGEGRAALTKAIRKTKADRVGTAIADLTICGAVPPYNEILGGKLVAMLVTSPEVVREYQRRYGRMPSIIASSMAGRAVIRAADLVFISTTSLYGRRPNQYDRISIPAERVNAGSAGQLKYEYLGRTKGQGTFHFGEHVVDALSTLLSQTKQGQRVNSVFGEGANPRLRKIRDGLDEVGLPSDELLDHGAPRLVYGVSLIENLTDYLLRIEKTPRYILPTSQPKPITGIIGSWWFERWCRSRAEREEIRERIEQHTLVHPIRHGARVKLPSTADEAMLFENE